MQLLFLILYGSIFQKVSPVFFFNLFFFPLFVLCPKLVWDFPGLHLNKVSVLFYYIL